jgi:hypothetical protein
VKFTEAEAALVEEVLRHDGFELLMRRSLEERDRIIGALARQGTDWDETNRLRGELKGLAHFTAEAIRKAYPPQSGNP